MAKRFMHSFIGVLLAVFVMVGGIDMGGVRCDMSADAAMQEDMPCHPAKDSATDCCIDLSCMRCVFAPAQMTHLKTPVVDNGTQAIEFVPILTAYTLSTMLERPPKNVG